MNELVCCYHLIHGQGKHDRKMKHPKKKENQSSWKYKERHYRHVVPHNDEHYCRSSHTPRKFYVDLESNKALQGIQRLK